MTARGMTRAAWSALEDGQEFQDHRRPSMASNSTKSIAEERERTWGGSTALSVNWERVTFCRGGF